MDISTLLYFLRVGAFVVNKNCEGITHGESLIHPQGGGHCLNWVMGHIVKTRNDALELVGKQPLYPESNFVVYVPGRFALENAITIEELHDSFNALQGPLEDGIRSLTVEKMLQPASFSPTGSSDETIGSLLAAILFHEAYHGGQLGIVRRALGKPGVIKNPAGE